MTEPPAAQRPPTSTYRLQLHSGFTFDDAAQVVPYLADLGVSHLYLSPILTAVPGSMHGYDVLDHTRVNPEFGGREGLLRLHEACREQGLGVIVDIVPNHMALVAPLWRNAPVWEVLRDGARAARAHWFDVEWAALDGRLGLPVLGAPLADTLRAGEITMGTGREDEGPAAGELVLRYHDHVWPVAPGTAEEEEGMAPDLATVLERQHYRLAFWKDRGEVLNYRRFFEVDGLIGVRVEEADVFEDTHRLILDLHHAGVVDGLRIDHPDGLADPAAYLAMLADHLRPGTPVWVEKILERGEPLPQDWACAGTTGYDANAALTVALLDPASAEEVSRSWAWVGGTPDLYDVVDAAKRDAALELLAPELARLHRLATKVLPAQDPAELRSALVEVLVAVDVYRAYLRPGQQPSPESAQRLQDALRRAGASAPHLGDTIEALGAVLADPARGGHDPVAAHDLAVRFQQTTGPVMAKGIEDTAFYRWHRLVALNEVGAHPSQGTEPSTEPLRTWAEHQSAHWPLGMTALSTHDTKRSEDVRARLIAVSGDGSCWEACRRRAVEAAQEAWIDAPAADLVMQTLLGAWPLTAERLEAYLTKALREAKLHTTWLVPDTDYESRVIDIGRQGLTSGDLHDAVVDALSRSERQIRTVVLSQKLLQLTLPGVADTYQGTELVDLSLVDPDNRRPVDYAERRRALARMDEGVDPHGLSEEKLLVTARTLRLRRRLPEVFGPQGSYRMVDGGPHLVGHLRAGRVAALAVRAPHSLGVDGFGNHVIDLPAGTWFDELTGRRVEVGGQGIAVADVFVDAPLALLVHEPEESHA